MKSFYLLLIVFSAISSLVHSEQTTVETQILANVVEGCVFTSSFNNSLVGRLDFGEHSNLNLVIDASTSNSNTNVQIQCTPGLSYSVDLTLGQHSLSSDSRRLFSSNSGSYIDYHLFQDARHTIPWLPGNGLSRQATGQPETLTIYGQVGMQPVTPEAGLYTDRITLIVSF